MDSCDGPVLRSATADRQRPSLRGVGWSEAHRGRVAPSARSRGGCVSRSCVPARDGRTPPQPEVARSLRARAYPRATMTPADRTGGPGPRGVPVETLRAISEHVHYEIGMLCAV